MRTTRWLAALVSLLVLAAAGVVLALHVDSARLLTHTVGVFALLGELLREGVLYPPEPTSDLVYSVFYHPLAFAPYALLPGAGLDLVAGMRVLVGCELLLCLGLLVWLAPAPGGGRALPAAWALCTVPVCFALVGMRDDPRGALFALLALAVYSGEGGRGTHPVLAGVLLALTFFVKATAAFAPGLALLFAALRAPRGVGRRPAWPLLAAAAGGVVAGTVFLQWGLGCDFLGNGLHYVFVDPAREPRTWTETFAALGRDLTAELALPALAAVSAAACAHRLATGRFDRYDVLVAATWLKTIVTYRSHGTDLNHLLEPALYCTLHVCRAFAIWLTPVRRLCVLAVLAGLGQPWRHLIPESGTPTLREGPLALAAAGLKSQAPVSTLCEEPFLGWLSGSRPLVTDPFLTFAALRDHPEIRARWFGPADHPAAVQRLVLMHDPFTTDPQRAAWVEHWYRHLHFDTEFLHMVRSRWRAVVVTDTATVLVRR